MKNSPLFWVWLSMSLKPSNRTKEILCAFSDPEDIYSMSREQRTATGMFTDAQLNSMDSVPIERAESVIRQCEKGGWHIITPESENYPSLLSKLPDMPIVLYADGNIELLREEVKIGVVGTRKPCADSVKIAHSISADLSRAGAVVVSGGAMGIDSAAHESVLHENGRTIAVLGSGFAANHIGHDPVLRRDLHTKALVLSEYAPSTSARPYTFPERNRIISGLSLGVLVVEAGEKSGSLITASCAIRQHREVYAIPGSVLTPAYAGANNMIKSGMARAVTSADDILEPFAGKYPNKIKLGMCCSLEQEKQIKPKNLPARLSENAKLVYRQLACAERNGEKKKGIDEICVECGLPMSKIGAALLELEMEALVESLAGKEYKLK